jgi:hypothetical protein
MNIGAAAFREDHNLDHEMNGNLVSDSEGKRVT